MQQTFLDQELAEEMRLAGAAALRPPQAPLYLAAFKSGANTRGVFICRINNHPLDLFDAHRSIANQSDNPPVLAARPHVVDCLEDLETLIAEGG